jgi:hypothetical protein
MEMNNINPMKLSNVVLDSETQKHFTSLGHKPSVHNTISKLIFDLAVEKPLWIFTAKGVGHIGIDRFVVTQDGEELGEISRTWYRSSDSIALTNDRIGAKRERTNSYRTSDATKALLTAKKMFIRKNSSELVEEAKKKAHDVLRSAKWDKERAIRNDEGNVYDAQLSFAKHAGYAMFIEHTKAKMDNKVLKSIENIDTYRSEMMSIESIQAKFDNGETALIVRTDGKYLVLIGEDANIYDDRGLPDNIRGKLAMLKLVEKEHIVTDMGCRVSDEVFVVVLTEAQDEVQSNTGV